MLFAQPPDSPLSKALKDNGYTVPEVFLMESDTNIDALDYIDDTGKKVSIVKGTAGLLKTFKQFVAHQHNQGIDYINDDDWKAITRTEFSTFRVTHANQ